MAWLRTQTPDRDEAEVRADRLRRHADAVGRWSTDRAVWLRCLADGYSAGAIDPCDDVRRPGAAPSAAWTRSRQQSARWLEQHGQPADPPEALRL